MIADKMIRISQETKKRLDNFKLSKRDTYDDIIMHLLEIAKNN